MQPGHQPGSVPRVADATMAEAKLVGDGAAGGQVILSAAARAALLAATGQGPRGRAATAGCCLIRMGRHVLVRAGACLCLEYLLCAQVGLIAIQLPDSSVSPERMCMVCCCCHCYCQEHTQQGTRKATQPTGALQGMTTTASHRRTTRLYATDRRAHFSSCCGTSGRHMCISLEA
jgi:hypothetical protein